MTISPFEALACPLDGSPLQRVEGSLRCETGHNFDVARQGYVHLLPVQKKRSLDPGDSKEMVAARQRFLNAGHYEPISDAVNHAAAGVFQAKNAASFLDAGCGEGYYIRRLANTLDEGQNAAVLGLDISKWAVLAAAKQDKRVRWVVGSNANLPVLPNELDCVLCLFGFPVYHEFQRVLKPGGQILQVDAGPDHLRELREIIYPELKPDRPDRDAIPDGFQLLGSEYVRYSLTLTNQDAVADLLAMTPHLYRASAEGRERAEALESLTVTVDAVLRRFERT
ncbi:putative RNA methyltransferase [Marinobacter sp. F4206]|uniref:putative RNA methyltransferase n=1 Tax=Marinobacter sp. F4206 TaxID=2861777 RepID=UPI001C5E992D|nr:methyltransferase domain-containing protein [Marinobacter sp. F4206]MBW4933242.1 methyltransferase domain-containing protein [Marinobacter sp. F4206]